MNEQFQELIQKFNEINEKGYIKGINNNLFNSCGLTFEKLLYKKADSMFFPDYKGIEIKCKQRYSRYDISLFSISFNGPCLFESNYLLKTYGKCDKKFVDKKQLFINFKYKEKVLVNDKHYFELDMDYENEMIFLNIYDLNGQYIEKRGFIDFKSINDRIKVKLNNLALVYASKKKVNDGLYFRYYKLVCYKYRGFDSFIKLLEKDVVKVSLVLRFAKSGADIGKNKNKNMVFKINDQDLIRLFNIVYFYEN